MNYSLDTDTCIDAIHGRHPSVARRILASRPGTLCIPALAKAELLLGLQLGQQPHRERAPLEALFRHLKVLPFEDRSAEYYAIIRADMQRKGRMIDANDLVIAATAIAHKTVLVTRNTRDFSRIPGLLLEDWTQP